MLLSKMRFVACCSFSLLAVLLLSLVPPGKDGMLTRQGITQNKKADSLLMVKDYLLLIKSAIPADSSQVKQKVTQLQQLVRQGSFQQGVMERQIRSMQGSHAQTLKDMVQQFRFIVQSAALLRSDLLQAGFSSGSAQEEMRYLHRHIPALVDQLYTFAKRAGR